MQAIAAKGMPKDKLVAGVPFYGRGWQGVESPDVWSPGAGTLAGRRLPRHRRNVPENARLRPPLGRRRQGPWLSNADKKEWITYEDPRWIAPQGRVQIAAQKLAGAMFWELSNDDGTLLDALRSGLGLGAPRPGQ